MVATDGVRGGDQPLDRFLSQLGFPGDFVEVSPASGEASVEAILFLKEKRPKKQNFWPGLALAILALAEEATQSLGTESIRNVLEAYPPEKTETGTVRNTLNIPAGGQVFHLRPKLNQAMHVIRNEMRRDHPSAAPHASQAWPAYTAFIEQVFAATRGERRTIAEHVWQTGVLEVSERVFAETAVRIARPFEITLLKFRTDNATPGGALFQALVFGYFRADSPNLTLESHSVNTGSSRADMPGDVAGFRGGEVELAVEVKDYLIDKDSVEAVLNDFLEDIAQAPNATAVVVATVVSDEARVYLEERNVIALSRNDLSQRVITWDLPKQQEALRGALYYLDRIQKKTALVKRLKDFLRDEQIDRGVLDVSAGKKLNDLDTE